MTAIWGRPETFKLYKLDCDTRTKEHNVCHACWSASCLMSQFPGGDDQYYVEFELGVYQRICVDCSCTSIIPAYFWLLLEITSTSSTLESKLCLHKGFFCQNESNLTLEHKDGKYLAKICTLLVSVSKFEYRPGMGIIRFFVQVFVTWEQAIDSYTWVHVESCQNGRNRWALSLWVLRRSQPFCGRKTKSQELGVITLRRSRVGIWEWSCLLKPESLPFNGFSTHTPLRAEGQILLIRILHYPVDFCCFICHVFLHWGVEWWTADVATHHGTAAHPDPQQVKQYFQRSNIDKTGLWSSKNLRVGNVYCVTPYGFFCFSRLLLVFAVIFLFPLFLPYPIFVSPFFSFPCYPFCFLPSYLFCFLCMCFPFFVFFISSICSFFLYVSFFRIFHCCFLPSCIVIFYLCINLQLTHLSIKLVLLFCFFSFFLLVYSPTS